MLFKLIIDFVLDFITLGYYSNESIILNEISQELIQLQVDCLTIDNELEEIMNLDTVSLDSTASELFTTLNTLKTSPLVSSEEWINISLRNNKYFEEKLSIIINDFEEFLANTGNLLIEKQLQGSIVIFDRAEELILQEHSMLLHNISRIIHSIPVFNHYNPILDDLTLLFPQTEEWNKYDSANFFPKISMRPLVKTELIETSLVLYEEQIEITKSLLKKRINRFNY